MHSDVPVGWGVSGRVPSEEIHLAEYLLELFLFGRVIISVDDHLVSNRCEQKFERVHYLYVATLLFAYKGSVYCESEGKRKVRLGFGKLFISTFVVREFFFFTELI